MEKPPEHLSEEGKALFLAVVADYEMEQAGRKILRCALEAFDRAQAARKQIDREGMVIQDRFGQQKPHPLLATERDSRASFMSGMKQLKVDVPEEDMRAPGRQPRGY